MEVDMALAELGMLAAVTEARREFLFESLKDTSQDKHRRLLNNENRRQHRITLQSAGSSIQDLRGWDPQRKVPLINVRKAWPHRSASMSRSRHLFMPYERSQQHRVTALCVQSPNIGTLQLPQLSQNKSNPPSPVKSNPYLLGVGTPLVRSKSLDNIALCPLEEIRKVDTIVESVSSKIGSLQLTAN